MIYVFQCREDNLRRRVTREPEVDTLPRQSEDSDQEPEVFTQASPVVDTQGTESQATLTFTQTEDPDTYTALIGGWGADERELAQDEDEDEEVEIYSQPDLYPQPEETVQLQAVPGQLRDRELRAQELQESGVFTQGPEDGDSDKENVPPGQEEMVPDNTQDPDPYEMARTSLRAAIAATPPNPPLRRPRFRMQVFLTIFLTNISDNTNKHREYVLNMPIIEWDRGLQTRRHPGQDHGGGRGHQPPGNDSI